MKLGYFSVVWALASLLPLYAQSTQSSLLGTVTDSSGAPMANATVTIRNEGTNFVREFKTDDAGDYRVSGLEAGFYEVKVAIAGFKTYEQTRVDLASAQNKRIDVKLQVGDITNTITVEGGTSQVETETSGLINVI